MPESRILSIQFQYTEDCPSHEAALKRLNQVLGEEGVRTKVHVVKVDTDAQARALNFVGSPTILINGVDIDPPPSDAVAALSCRAYRLEDGRISPLPSAKMMRRALQRALTS